VTSEKENKDKIKKDNKKGTSPGADPLRINLSKILIRH